jgi:hypothetical protein
MLRTTSTALALALACAAAPASAGVTIPLQGTAGVVCTINVTPDAAALSLPITTPGAQTVTVGTVLQTCNQINGYTLSVSDLSGNCTPAPTGAKLVESGSGTRLPYSVNAVNPTTGGSTANVTGLLASACTNQIARDVTGSVVTTETSTIAVSFTGNATLFPGTYNDTLTFTMTTK